MPKMKPPRPRTTQAIDVVRMDEILTASWGWCYIRKTKINRDTISIGIDRPDGAPEHQFFYVFRKHTDLVTTRRFVPYADRCEGFK